MSRKINDKKKGLTILKSEVVGPVGPVDQYEKFDCSVDHESSETVSSFEKYPGSVYSSEGTLSGLSRKGGVTHNMLDDIHNHWTGAEAVRIKCLAVPTLDMEFASTLRFELNSASSIYLDLVLIFGVRKLLAHGDTSVCAVQNKSGGKIVYTAH
ncbi:unnamed protein product [Prunus armeniaca]|uniref:Uncharacterized protein n=1 Tax=Prunus armeniaca TaxID=36596 RepID=A0A6J5X6X7_PRUAR|nr:unnamed protein product [Prunus armeniaca]